MKKVITFVLALFCVGVLFADTTGWYTSKDELVPGEKRFAGNTVETEPTLTITTDTATAIFTGDKWNCNTDIFNNSAYTIWIGSNTTTLNGRGIVGGYQTGFPILSSSTFTLDGNFTGTIYGMVDASLAGDLTNGVKVIHYKIK